MSWPYPLFGLVRRPGVPVFVVILAIPILAISLIPVAPGKALESEIAAGVAQVGMVAMVGALSGLVGMLWSLSRHDLWKSGLDWHLPGVRRWFLLEELLIATVVALGAATWIVVVHSEGPLAVRIIVAVSFALAALAAGGFEHDPSTPGVFRFVGFFGLYVPLFQAAAVERVLLAMPPITVTACLGAAALLWRRRLDRRIARRRRHDGLASAATGQPGAEPSGYWEQHGGPHTEWARPLTSNRLLPWLHASAHESVAGAFWGPLGFMALTGLLVAVVVHYFSGGYFALFNIGMVVWAFAVFPFRLRSGLAYPLSRPQRARLVATGALLQESALTLSTLVFLAVLKLTPLANLGRLRMPGEVIDWPVTLLVIFAWIPIVSWGSVQAAAGDWRVGRNPLAAGLVPLLAYLGAAALTLRTLGDWWRSGDWALVVVLVAIIAVGTRAALWWATHRLFARADLSPVVAG